MKTDYFWELDLGKPVDHTAMALVTPVMENYGGFDFVRWTQPRVERLRVVHLERLPLGTRNFEVARQVGALVKQVGARRCEVVADATGAGLPVVEMPRPAEIGAPIGTVMGKLVVEMEQGRRRLSEGLPLAVWRARR